MGEFRVTNWKLINEKILSMLQLECLGNRNRNHSLDFLELPVTVCFVVDQVCSKVGVSAANIETSQLNLVVRPTYWSLNWPQKSSGGNWSKTIFLRLLCKKKIHGNQLRVVFFPYQGSSLP